MKISYGLKNGAVLQRDEQGYCKCYFKADTVGKLVSSIGEVVKQNEELYLLRNIPVGGPYEITLSDEEGTCTFTDIYVGDLWLLGGQSNMEGAGKWRDRQREYDENPAVSIRAYYMNECWGPAKSQLHQPWESKDECICGRYREDRKKSLWAEEFPPIQKDGVGPGLFFAREMQDKSKVPQGVIPCAVGGASLDDWKPGSGNNFYAAALRRFRECGRCVRGVFWYQGESQAGEEGCQSFVADMKELVSAMRRDFDEPHLPFVQVQINNFVRGEDLPWMKIRELQRTLDQHIPQLATVYSVDCQRDDLIHLSSEAQENIGKRAAEAMHLLLTGEGDPSPDLDYLEIVPDDFVPFWSNIIVHYKNVAGGLKAAGVPSGYELLQGESASPAKEIARLCIGEDFVRIKVEMTPEQIKEYFLCYAYGNSFYCNITDGAGRSIPAFGPLKIKDYVRE